MKKLPSITLTLCIILVITIIPLLAIACGGICKLEILYTPVDVQPSFSYSPDPQWEYFGYDCGTEITIGAGVRPLSGYVFDRWSGDVPAGKEHDNPLTITMDSDKTITAHFRSNICKLEILYTPVDVQPSFSYSPDPQWEYFGYDCGTEITVGAGVRPLSGYVFDRWSGDVPAGKEHDNPLTITMDSDKIITAHFRSNICKLKILWTPVDVQPSFSYSPDPQWEYFGYDCGTEVTVGAGVSPLSGYVFDRWCADVPAGKEHDNPLTITMDSDKTLTAHFKEIPAHDVPPAENTLSVDFTLSGQCNASEAGCTCTVNYTVNAEDISTGDKYPVTNVKLEINDGTGWQTWYDSVGISQSLHHHSDLKTGAACGKTFNVRATATNSIGQTVTATGTFTTSSP